MNVEHFKILIVWILFTGLILLLNALENNRNPNVNIIHSEEKIQLNNLQVEIIRFYNRLK